jgi:hypothetical protein
VLLIPTGGKLATGVNDSGGKFDAGVNTPLANLPSISMTPAVNFVIGTAGVVDTCGK